MSLDILGMVLKIKYTRSIMFCIMSLFLLVSAWFSIDPIHLYMSKSKLVCYTVQFSSVQLLSRVRLFVTPWIAALQDSLSTQTHVHRVTNAIQPSHLCRPLLLLPPIPPSIRVFSNESTLPMRWPNYWSFSFSIIPSKEIPGLIFRMDWLDLMLGGDKSCEE